MFCLEKKTNEDDVSLWQTGGYILNKKNRYNIKIVYICMI